MLKTDCNKKENRSKQRVPQITCAWNEPYYKFSRSQLERKNYAKNKNALFCVPLVLQLGK